MSDDEVKQAGMTDWHSNQKTSSPEEIMHQSNVRGGVQNVVGDSLKITVIVLCLFLQ